MKTINNESKNILSKFNKILFYIALVFILAGFFYGLITVYTVFIMKNDYERLNINFFYLSMIFTLLGLVLMNFLRTRLERQNISILRKINLAFCSLGYLIIFAWTYPILFKLSQYFYSGIIIHR